MMSIWWGFILQYASHSCVVKSAKASSIWSSSHEESGVGVMRFGFEKNISGLARGNKDGVGCKWFYVNCICFNNCEGVVRNAEE